MTLRLTSDEAAELRKALLSAHAHLLRSLAEGIGCGYSAEGIGLCARRARVARVLDQMDRASRPVEMIEGVLQIELSEAA